MGFAQTFNSQNVEWQGFTWTFSEPVQYGYYINGDPFVVIPSGQGLTLTGVSPAPKYYSQSVMTASTGDGTPIIPINQFPGYTYNITTLNPISSNSLLPNFSSSGITAMTFGFMPNSSNTDIGLYINGTVKNPIRALPFSIKTQPFSSNDRIIITNNNLNSSVTQCFHSRTRFSDFVAYSWKFSAADWDKLINMNLNPIKLIAGDVLMSLKCPYADGQPFAKAGLISGGSYLSNAVPNSRLGGLSTVEKVGLLTFVSDVPYDDSFRPPFVWTIGDEGNRPTGFTYGSIPAGRTAAFINIPTKNIDGTTAIPYNTSLSYGSCGGIPCPFDSVSVNDLLPAPLPYFPFASGRLGNSSQRSDNIPTWNFLKRTLSEMADTNGITFASFISTTSVGALNNATAKAAGIACAINNSFNSLSANTFYLDSSMAANVGVSVAEMMMAYNAINCFGSWLSDADRKKCLIKLIQYGIDLYGCHIAGQLVNAGYHGENDLTQSSPSLGSNPNFGRHAVSIAENARPFIILAGWLLNNEKMMNIDSEMASRCEDLYQHSILPGTSLPEWNIGGTADIFAAIMFHEVYKYRKLGGTWNNDISGTTTGRGFWYTDPGTTADVGIGFGLKNNIGQDGQLGVQVAFAGETWGNEPIRFLDSPSTIIGTPITVSTSPLDSFAIIGATAYAGTGRGFPPGNSGYYQFPKTNCNTAYYGFVITDALRSAPNGTKIIPHNSMTNLLYTNVKIISGPGSGPTVYKIIKIMDRSNIDRLINVPASNWTGTQLVRFLLDKPWQNGPPTSESRFIIYPFDSSDIGKYVQSRHFPFAHTSYSGAPSLNSITHTSSKDDGWGFSIASRTSFVNGCMSVDKACLVMYGLLYALGKRSGGSIILQNPRTLNVIDGIIDLTFSVQPHAHTEYFYDPSPEDNVDEYNSTVMFQHKTNHLHKRQKFLGGILRSLWEREAPLSRS